VSWFIQDFILKINGIIAPHIAEYLSLLKKKHPGEEEKFRKALVDLIGLLIYSQ
jgi:hypothetical protein